jgi:predicted Zn-dependent protease with MMP-like domain
MRPRLLGPPQVEVREERRGRLEAARRIGHEDIDLVVAAPDRQAPAAFEELTQLGQQLRNVDTNPHYRTPRSTARDPSARGAAYACAMASELEFEAYIEDAVESLPDDLRDAMSNVELVVEIEPPPGLPLLGLYQGIPLTRRGSFYAGALPDKITIYRGPLERLYGDDPDRLRSEVQRVVLHEIAHHFGISDERLRELDRY